MTITAIETQYAGCRFRSRLEARWAVFFDRLGIRWEYEPQGFAGPGWRYLPDFYLPQINGGLWFEVKPDNPAITENPAWIKLVEGTKKELIVAYGMWRPGHDIVWGSIRIDGWMESYQPDLCYEGETVGWDHGRAFTKCFGCDTVGIAWQGRLERVECTCQPTDKILQALRNIIDTVEEEDRDLTDEEAGRYEQLEMQLEASRDNQRKGGPDHPDIWLAYEAASSARFEHGENGR